MKKVPFNHIFIIFFAFFISGSSNSKVSLNKLLKKYEWKKRVVLVIESKETNYLIKEVIKFFETYNCENRLRKMELIKIYSKNINNYDLPNRFKNKYGVWLIGYDGDIKGHSFDHSVLKKLHDIIDLMPIRKMEMAQEKPKCK